MKFTNKNNLPDYLYNLLAWDYKPVENRIGVSQLVSEPLPRNLKIKHYDDLIIDVSDRLSSVIGRSLHYFLLHKASEEDDYAEVKQEDIVNGITVVGKSDNYHEASKTITDFKSMKIWGWIFRDRPGSQLNKYIAQVNCYIWQWKRRGFEIEKAYLDLFFMDWSKSKATYEKDYPKQFEHYPIPIWSFEEQEAYINRQLEYHKIAKFNECSPIEKWQKEFVYAVMKQGNKRAVKLFGNKKDAITFMDGDSKLFIQERPGECTKCLYYCDVAQVCPFAIMNRG